MSKVKMFPPPIFNARNFIVAFFFFSLSICVVGQTPTPTPDNDTIRVNTDLIQTNVTVVDKNNRFVDGLKQEQFELRVDGKQMPINFFDAVVAPARTNENLPNNLRAQTNSASDNPTLNERRVIFFVDDLHLSLDSLARTRSTVNHFIDDEMQPRDSVLIVSASGQVGFLQQFTNNKAVLRAALARLKYFPASLKDTDTPPMPDHMAIRILGGDRDAAEYYIVKIIEGMKSSVNGVAMRVDRNAVYETVKQRANNIVANLASVSDATLLSLDNLIKTTNQMNGKKLVFFISDGFYLDSKNSNLAGNTKFLRVLDRAARSGCVVYTIDARGLFMFAPDATGERPIDSSGMMKSRVGEDNAAQEALAVLADETGGRFLKNQNYFERWVDKMLDENAGYYVLAWTPEKEAAGDKNFRRIEVGVVGRPDLTVRLARGYLASPEKLEPKGKGNKKENSDKKPVEVAAAPTIEQPPPNPKKILPLTLAVKYLDVPNVGGVLTSSVQVDAKNLDYGADGKQSATVDIGGVVLNDQGKQVADLKTRLNVAARSSADGGQEVIYNNRTPLAPGIYQVRVGAREAKSGQTGTASEWIEIPDLTRRQLTLGTLMLDVKEIKKSDKPEDVQIQFSVDSRFARPLQLSFMSFIYNAARGAGGEVNLMTKIEIFDAAGRAIVNTPMRPLDAKGIEDLARIPFTGALRQQQSQPGTYLLRVTVSDLTAKTTAVEQTIFTIE